MSAENKPDGLKDPNAVVYKQVFHLTVAAGSDSFRRYKESTEKLGGKFIVVPDDEAEPSSSATDPGMTHVDVQISLRKIDDLEKFWADATPQ